MQELGDNYGLALRSRCFKFPPNTLFSNFRVSPPVLLLLQVFSPFIVAFGEEGTEQGDVSEHPLPRRTDTGDEASGIGLFEDPACPEMTTAGTVEEARAPRDEQTARRTASSSIAAPEVAPASTVATTLIATSAASTTGGAAAPTPRALREEETATTPLSAPGGVDAAYGGLAQALPANVGLMTLMRIPTEEEEKKDLWPSTGDWSAGEGPVAGMEGKLTLLVRKAGVGSRDLS